MPDVIEPLYGGLTFRHADALPRPGADAYILADFALTGLKKGSSLADVGSGTGIIPVLASRSCARVLGIEIDCGCADAARENIRRNGIDNAEILNIDARSAELLQNKRFSGAFDAVTCNPPYFTGETRSPDARRAGARNDITLTIADACRTASRLLAPGGTFYFIFRPERLTAALAVSSESGLEPKLVRFVAHDYEKAPYAFLCAARKGARPGGLAVAPTLVTSPGSPELGRIYHRDVV